VRPVALYLGQQPDEVVQSPATAKASLTQDFSEAEIAARLGYYDPSRLNRHFRDTFKVSTGAYAKAVR
jgi:AraC-like DNA-binding protein